MVYLNRIYTKTGDAGETMLGDGARVPKTGLRIVAYGGTDELNAVIGVAVAAGGTAPWDAWLRTIQNDLFDLGADLCVPEDCEEAGHAAADSSEGPPPLRVTSQQVARLEDWIDSVNADLPALKSFILPGGTPASAHLHHARTVCRRVEIDVLRLAAAERVNPQVTIYLNRLSDLLFVLARTANDGGKQDVLWEPGRSRTLGPATNDADD